MTTSEELERVGEHAEELLAGWYDSVERVEDDEESLVVKDGDGDIVGIIALDESTLEAMAEADEDGELASWLREELESQEGWHDEPEDREDRDTDAAADAWLGAAPLAGAAAAAGPGLLAGAGALAAAGALGEDDDEEDGGTDSSDDDFDLDDWEDPEADALIDELPV